MSIFGGVDLLGEMTKSTEEVKKEAPPTSRKPRQRKSSSGSGLFGELEEGEDDIFAFSGKKRYNYTGICNLQFAFRCTQFVNCK